MTTLSIRRIDKEKADECEENISDETDEEARDFWNKPLLSQIILHKCQSDTPVLAECFDKDDTGFYYVKAGGVIQRVSIPPGNDIPRPLVLPICDVDLNHYNISLDEDAIRYSEIMFVACNVDVDGGAYPVCLENELTRISGGTVFDWYYYKVYYKDDEGHDVEITLSAGVDMIQPFVLSADDVSDSLATAARAAGYNKVMFMYCPPLPIVCHRCYKEGFDDDDNYIVYWENVAGERQVITPDAVTGRYPPYVAAIKEVNASLVDECNTDCNPGFNDQANYSTANKAMITNIMFSRCVSDYPIIAICYDVETTVVDGMEKITKIYWVDKDGANQDAPMNPATGAALPIYKRIDEISVDYYASYNLIPEVTPAVVIIPCVPYMEEFADTDCNNKRYIKLVAANNGLAKQVKWDYRDIAGFSSSGKYGLIIENGCPKWLEMEDC